MATKKKISGFALATAAAAAFIAIPAGAFADDTEDSSSMVDTVTCYSINSCKGQSACKTTSSQCKGLNTCKGKGITVVESAKACTDQGGSITEK
jgi:hypothetical protein